MSSDKNIELNNINNYPQVQPKNINQQYNNFNATDHR